MKTCKDCIHYNACSANGGLFNEKETTKEMLCNHFKDKSLVLDLPCKPISVMSARDECNSDVYCPYCGTNLSGLYGEEPTEIIQCYNCGNFLDNTKVITIEAAEQALKEREQG